MTSSQCIVVGNKDRQTPRIQSAINSEQRYHNLECQFGESELYEHDGEKYCIMHLPFEGKKQHKLSDKATDFHLQLRQKNHVNYNFVNLSNASFYISTPHVNFGNLSFDGAYLFSCTFFGNRDLTNHSPIDFFHTLFEGITPFKNVKATIIRIFHSEIFGQIEIRDCQIETLAICDSLLGGEHGIINREHTDKLQFPNSTIDNLNFNNNTCKLLISFDFATIYNLYLSSKFYVAPSFFNVAFKKNNKIVLPKKEDFVYEYRNLSTDIKEFFRNNWSSYKQSANGILESEFIHLREIYTLTKNKELNKEQGDYFYLMNYVNERNSNISIVRRVLGILYRWVSNYGTSLTKIVGYFLIINTIFTLFYIMNYISPHPILTSTHQILKPFNLFFDNTHFYRFVVYFVVFLQSIISISLAALFLITLRWNFKRD